MTSDSNINSHKETKYTGKGTYTVNIKGRVFLFCYFLFF